MAPPRRLTLIPLRNATVAESMKIKATLRNYEGYLEESTKKNFLRFCTKSSALTYRFINFKSANTVIFAATDI